MDAPRFLYPNIQLIPMLTIDTAGIKVKVFGTAYIYKATI